MHIGQKVVCVDDQNFLAPQLMSEFPKKGVIYTIRGSFPAIDKYGETKNILLEELNNPIANNGSTASIKSDSANCRKTK